MTVSQGTGTPAGAGGTGTAATLTVSSVGAGGAITGVSVAGSGSYSSYATTYAGGTASYVVNPAMTFATTSSSATGLTVSPYWCINDVAQVVGGSAGSLANNTTVSIAGGVLAPTNAPQGVPGSPSTGTFTPAAGGFAASFQVQVSGGAYNGLATSSLDGGLYSVLPTMPVAVGGGSGSGATFNLTATDSGTGIAAATMVTAGSGYAAGNTLTVVSPTGTTGNPTQATLTVTSVNGSGGVTGINVATPGSYTASAYNVATGATTVTNNPAFYVTWTGNPNPSTGIFALVTCSVNSPNSNSSSAAGMSIVNPGSYSVGDLLNVTSVKSGTWTGSWTTNPVVQVASVNHATSPPTVIVNMVNPGAYSGGAPAASTVFNTAYATTNPYGGTGATVTLQLSDSGAFSAVQVATGGGAKYQLNDVLAVQGGTAATAATLTVTAVSGSGAVTGVTVANAGSYSALPTNPVGTTDNGPGTGTGATFNLVFITPAAASATVVNGGGPLGDTYAVGDLITVVGGGTGSTPAVLTVDSVNNGQVATVHVSNGGYYTSPPTNPVATTDSNGTALGATFNLTIAPLLYAPTGGVAATIPGGATAPSTTSLVGTPSNVSVAAIKYTSTSIAAGTYTVQFPNGFTLTYGPLTTNNPPPTAPGATYNITQLTLTQAIAGGTSANVVNSAGGTFANGWGKPSQTMSDYYDAFWPSQGQDTPVYTLTTVTTPMTWDVVTPPTPGSPAIPSLPSFSFNATPGDSTMGLTNYVGNAGMYDFNKDVNGPANGGFSDGPYYADSTTRITDISDGTSNTLAFGEALGGSEAGQPTYGLTWMGTGAMPSYWDCQTPAMWFTFGSAHSDLVNFAFCDGSVRGITKVQATDKSAIPPPDPPAAMGTPRWTAFQNAAGTKDGNTPDWNQLGSAAAGN